MKRSLLAGVGAFVLAAALFAAGLGALPLIEPDEGRNAEVAREMLAARSWIVPLYDGLPYLDKPAAYFVAVAAAFRTLGVHEAAARVPSVLSGLGLLALFYIFCRRTWGARTAALAVVIAASTPLCVAFARTVIFDMPLTLFVSGAILAVFEAERLRRNGPAERRAGDAVDPQPVATSRANRLYLVAAACAAVATLIKGPVGFLVPLLVVLAVHLPRERWGFLDRVLSLRCLAVFFALTLPWFVALSKLRPDFPQYGLVEETLRRYSTGSFHRTAPFYYYLPVVFGVFFPWSVLLPEGIALAWKRRRRLDPADRLFIVWAIVVVLFFSTSQSKLPGYVLSGVAALAIPAARLFDRAFGDPRGRAAALVFRAAVALAAVSAILAALLLANALRPGTLQHLFRIRSAEFDRLQPVFLPAGISLFAVTAAALIARFARKPAVVLGAFLLFPVSLLTVSFGGLRAYAAASSSKPLVRGIQPLPEATTVATVECFPTGLPFYLSRPVTLITQDGHELTSNYVLFRLRRARKWPDTLVRRAEAGAWIDRQEEPVYLVARSRGRALLDSLASVHHAVVETPAPGYFGLLLGAERLPVTAPQADASEAR